MTPLRPALAAVLVALLACPAAAHEKQVHSDLIDTAFQIILIAEQPQYFAGAVLPPGVSAADAEALRVAMVQTPQRLARLPFDAGEPFAPCPTFQPRRWATLGDADGGMSIDYKVGARCEQTDPVWSPGGFLDDAGITNNRLRFIGPTLGYLAAHADDEYKDTTLWVRPSNIGVTVGIVPVGPGAAASAANAALDFGLAAVFLPILCVADFIAGNTNCVQHAIDAADTANPIDEIAGAVPGISATNTSDPDVTGLWHHINVGPFTSNEYDDAQGFLLDQAGPYGCQDVLETGLIIAGDVTGMSVNYDESNGPKRYEVVRPNDGSPATDKRSKSQWQFHTVGHTAMEPLDNLAYFGWRQFLVGNHSAEALEWPLHAIGDAVSPMHTIGSPGWGHRPFELSIERDWDQVRFLVPNDVPAQLAQVKRVFSSALRYRKLILDWRRNNPQPIFDVPVRELITTLARDTYTMSMQTMLTAGWPYSQSASADDFLGSPSTFYDRPDNAALVRPLIENGMGAAIAFLVSASEVVP